MNRKLGQRNWNSMRTRSKGWRYIAVGVQFFLVAIEGSQTSNSQSGISEQNPDEKNKFSGRIKTQKVGSITLSLKDKAF